MDLNKAIEFIDSYAAAALHSDPQLYAAHYAEPYTSFTLGNVTQFATQDAALEQMVPYLQRFKERGLEDIRMARVSIDTVSDTFALCHITWEIRPRTGEGWQWVNIYGLRQDGQGQRFEFAISDNEISNLLQRFPDFLS